MASYYVVSAIIMALGIIAFAVVVIHALNKKGDVSAGLQLSRLGFTLTAKDRSNKLEP
jgi:hypothetical protein